MKCIFCIIFTLTCFATANVVRANEKMPCVPDGDCNDPCIYFDSKVVFVDTGVDAEGREAKLKYRGKVLDLKYGFSKEVRKHQPDVDVPGDIEIIYYKTTDLNVELRKKTLDTSCSVKVSRGKWESVESCCWTTYDVKLKIRGSRGVEKFQTSWASGC